MGKLKGILSLAQALRQRLHSYAPWNNQSPHLFTPSVILHQRSAYEDAVEYIKGGDLSTAEGLLNRILIKDPHHHEARRAYANILFMQGKTAVAIKHYEQLLSTWPDDPLAQTNYGNALREAGQYEKALRHLMRAATLKPTSPEFAYNFGVCLKECGRIDEALSQFKAAIELRPTYQAALRAAFQIFREASKFSQAISLLDAHVHAHGESAEAYFLLGLGFYWTGDFTRSEAFLERAVKLDPSFAEAWDNLGVSIHASGRPLEALNHYTHSIMINPLSDTPRWHRALANLSLGNFAEGWDDYAFRPGAAAAVSETGLQEWQGQCDPHARLLILPEQGLGDEIMFASCAADAAARVGRTLMICAPKVQPIFERSFPNVLVRSSPVTYRDAKDHADYVICSGSLPRIFRRSRDTFPNERIYLVADEFKVAHWRKRLNDLGSCMKIGISWQGGTLQTHQSVRSIPLLAWLSVLRTPDCRFISLQYTDCFRDLIRFNQLHGVQITHWQDAIDDYDQTAALISALDLVISVQTAVVHLSGALGKSTWALVPISPEWRYGVEVIKMPWYRDVSIYRQDSAGNWAPLMEMIAMRLQTLKSAMPGRVVGT